MIRTMKSMFSMYVACRNKACQSGAAADEVPKNCIAFWKVWTPLLETWRLDQSDDVAAPYAMDCDTAAEGGSARPDFHASPLARLHQQGGKRKQSDSEEAGSPATPRTLPMHLAGSASRTIGGQQKPTHGRRKGRPVVASDSDDPVDRIGQMIVSARAMQNERAIAADKARENEIVVRQAEHKLELEDRATQRKHQQDMMEAQQKFMLDIISAMRPPGGSGTECPHITYFCYTVPRI